MGIVNGLSIVNNLIAGSMTGAQLQTYLATGANLASFVQVTNVRRQLQVLRNTPAAVTAVTASATASATVAANDAALRQWLLYGTSYNWRSFANLAVGLRLPGMGTPMMFPAEWIQPDRKNRVVQLYPGARMGPLPMALSGFGLSALNSGQVIPNAWQVAYTAGYTDEDLSGDDADVGRAVGQIATIAALVPGSIDRFMAQGVAGLSVSVDGLSNSTQLLQSAGNLRYGALIAAMRESLEPWERMFHARKGIQSAHA